MRICPFDMGWCRRRDCAAGICKLAADVPLTPCEGCGELIERAVAAGNCIDCPAVTLDDQRQGR